MSDKFVGIRIIHTTYVGILRYPSQSVHCLRSITEDLINWTVHVYCVSQGRYQRVIVDTSQNICITYSPHHLALSDYTEKHSKQRLYYLTMYLAINCIGSKRWEINMY